MNWQCVLLLLVFFYFSSEFYGAGEEVVFSNSWAVEILGGPEAADEIAKKHGFINKGQVGSLTNIYHFVHVLSPLKEKRNVQEYHPQHSILKQYYMVGYVEQQVIRSRVKREVTYTYSSSPSQKWNQLWYLHRPSGHDMNLEEAWQLNYTGRGIVVSILDDGLEYTHPDLQHNYDPRASYDLNDHDYDPLPRYDPTNENKHGTRCAGEVAAIWGGQCCVGASFNAKIGGVRMLDGEVNDLVEASALSLNPQYIDIYSSSWGPNDDGATVDGPRELAQRAFLNGTLAGRNGLGSIYVWAAGNGGRYEDSCNCDGYALSPLTISVGSASERDERPWYLEQCSSTLVSTYSSGGVMERQIISTDLHGTCTSRHTGTSASAPLAAGILALALEANPMLTWRDAQYLLVYSSNPDYPKDDHWQINGAGLKVSHWYGFGIIDGTSLVNRAKHWHTVPPRNNCTFNATSKFNGGEVATAEQSLIVKVQVENCRLSALEHVQAFTTIQIREGMRKDISIHLISPAGTNSILLPLRPHDISKEGFSQWPFMTVQSWGEKPNGNWIITIDLKGRTKVELTSLELILFGTLSVPLSIQSIPSACHPECVKGCAQEGPQYCDSCKHFRVSSSLECVTQCPEGTYFKGSICFACSDYCIDCDNAKSCKRCLPNTYLVRNTTCLPSCPSNSFTAPDNTCISCHQSCLSCNGPLQSDCTQCHSQFILVNNSCIIREATSCFEGAYFDHRLHECHSCHKTCASCTGRDRTQCSSCPDGRTLSLNGICTACEHGQYLNSQTMECMDCPRTCSDCSDNITCLSCQEGYFLTSNADCVAICPENTTVDINNVSCIENSCLPTCSNCTDSNECLNCTMCVTECPSKFFRDLNSCKKCHPSCQSCTGPLENQCLSCSPNYFRTNHACVTSCPSGTFLLDNKCVHCIDNCSRCTSKMTCDLCAYNLYFLSDHLRCVHQCPDSYFEDAATRKCEKCPQNCNECHSRSVCSSCQEGFVYYAPNCSCIKQCPDGYFSFTNDECIPCKFPCSTCIGTDSNCSVCSAGMALDIQSQECKKCCYYTMELQCCDCDKDNMHCVLSTSQTTNNQLAPVHTRIRSMQLIAVVLVVILLVVLVVIVLLNMIFRRKCRKEVHIYKPLPHDDGMECETEIL